LRALIAAGRVVSFAAGKQVATRQEKRADLALILEGMLRVYSVSADGREYRISLQEPGEIHGLLSCLDDDVSPHDAVADTDLAVLFISAARFKRLMAQHEQFREAVIGILCLRLRQSFVMLDNFAIGSPKLRLAQRLLELAEAYGRRVAQGAVIDFKVTQDSLGAMFGLSRQRTNLYLKSFESAGLISLEGGKVVLLKPEGLMGISG
jgi:CRP-like cAMP-binding protein